jgi:hypothetical protein
MLTNYYQNSCIKIISRINFIIILKNQYQSIKNKLIIICRSQCYEIIKVFNNKTITDWFSVRKL